MATENAPNTNPTATLPEVNTDLEAVLAAWHTATVRLEETHKTLQEEVRHLTEELEVKNRELARKNRLADLGQMASHIAHEVRNNLVPVTLYLSLLRRRISDDPGSLDIVDKIVAGFTALDATVNDLLHFTADRDPRLGSFSLRELVDEMQASLAPQFSAQAIATTIDIPDDLPITADRNMLRRVVLNLILNALDAMPDGGTLTIIACETELGVEIEVADSGPGLSKDAEQRLFDPFFSTKCGGTGLGLAIVSRIAEVHGGDVMAQNCPDGGAAVTLCIPQLTASMEAAA